MNTRPAWVPGDLADEDVQRYAETLGGSLARLAWEARQAGAHDVLAGIDQVEAMLRDESERLVSSVLIEGGDS